MGLLGYKYSLDRFSLGNLIARLIPVTVHIGHIPLPLLPQHLRWSDEMQQCCKSDWLGMCFYVYVFVCISLSLFLCHIYIYFFYYLYTLCVCVYVCLSVCLCVCVCVCVCVVCVCICVYVCVCVSFACFSNSPIIPGLCSLYFPRFKKEFTPMECGAAEGTLAWAFFFCCCCYQPLCVFSQHS